MFLNSFFHRIFFKSRSRRYRVSNSCSNVLISVTLFGKERECQSFDVCPRQHSHNSCYLMIVLVRGVLSAKLVLRYKHIFEAIFIDHVSKLSSNKLFFVLFNLSSLADAEKYMVILLVRLIIVQC